MSNKKKIKQFELPEEFQKNYPDITDICIQGKNLIFRTIEGKFVHSKYYDDDITKTLQTLKEEFLSNSNIEISFVHESMEDFLKDFGQILTWRSISPRTKEEEGEGDDSKPLPVFPAYKYTCLGELHESVFINGIPFFIKYDSTEKKIIAVEKIEENSRILRPPNREEYPYTPYEFVNNEQLQRYLDIVRYENIDTLYCKAKSIVRRFNDQDEHVLNLFAIDTVWSYFQDKFGTTHYIGEVGDNNSGKTSLGDTFQAIAYRVVNMTSPSASNVFRMLGLIEAGQCVLVLDESDKIDEDTDMLNILKSGYDKNKKVSKTNTVSWKLEWFYAYCLKIIIAEKSLNRLRAKGLLDRTFPVNCIAGDPKDDIKEVVNSEERDPHLDRALKELLDFRRLMLIYRLVHYNNPIVNLNIGFKRRNKELCKPQLRLFYGSKTQKEVEQTFQTLINIKDGRKARGIEAILIPFIQNLIKEEGEKIPSSRIWEAIKENIEGESPLNKPDEYHTADHILYKNTVTKILEDKFGAEIKHTNKGNMVIFNPKKLEKIARSYDSHNIIKLNPISEGSEGSEGYLEDARSFKVPKEPENLNISQDITKKDVKNIQENVLERPNTLKEKTAYSNMPSQPSHPSPSNIYRLGKSDRWGCNNCKQKGDIWEMKAHPCKMDKK